MFEIDSQDGAARAGIFETAHYKIKTPFFMPVATKGTAKLLTMGNLKDAKTECIICNGFIMSLKPGVEVIKKAGGIHKFIGWDRAIFTDSGGFQVLGPRFMLGHSKKGILFNDPFSNKKSLLTPERAIQIQNNLGSDVAMALDMVPEYGGTWAEARRATFLTHEWARHCLKAHSNDSQLLFGIAQGGEYLDLRKLSAKRINSLGFDGVAFGGVCVGEPKEIIQAEILSQINEFDSSKVRYLMGVGDPVQLLESISLGIDAFDSAYPTFIGRRGFAFTSHGLLEVRSRKYSNDFEPMDPNCSCYTCEHHTRAFVSHLFSVEEEIGKKLVSIHNLFFIQNLIEKARRAIAEGKFEKFKEEFVRIYSGKNQ